jgi:septal ring factor EnvC (AmiA/AmiB activator)
VKIVGTLSKSVGFLKLESDISCYRRQHIVGSLFYSNFKVRLFSKLSFLYYLRNGLSILIFTCFAEYVLSKALKMQQDTEDRKNEVIIEGLEVKIKKLEDSLREKDILLQSVEGSLAEARSQNDKLNRELDKARAALKERSERFDLETKELKAKVEAEAERNAKLNETVKKLRDKCSGFAA